MKLYPLVIFLSVSALASHPPTKEDDLSSIIERMDVDESMDLPTPRGDRGTKRKSSDESSDEGTSQTRKRVRVRRSTPAIAEQSSTLKACKAIPQLWPFSQVGTEEYSNNIKSIAAKATSTHERSWKVGKPKGGYTFVNYMSGRSLGGYVSYPNPGIQVQSFKKVLNQVPGQTPEEHEREVEGFKLADNNVFKIHILVKDEYIAWTLAKLVKTLKKLDCLDYTFKIITKSSAELATRYGFRTTATIVLYVPSDPIYNEETDAHEINPAARIENVQKLFDALYKKFQHCTQLITGQALRHNCGGPIVWIAGGDADLKPGGEHYYYTKGIWRGDQKPEDLEGDSPILSIYKKVGQTNGFDNYPYYATQANPKVHTGFCSEITG